MKIPDINRLHKAQQKINEAAKLLRQITTADGVDKEKMGKIAAAILLRNISLAEIEDAALESLPQSEIDKERRRFM